MSPVVVTGDKGKPYVNVPKTVGAAYNSVAVNDVLGNTLFCDTLVSLVNSSTVEVHWGTLTGKILSATEIAGFKDGSVFDADQDGKVDYTDTNIRVAFTGVNVAAITAANADYTVKLPGNGTKRFYPQRYYAICRTASHLNGDTQVDLGTTDSGNELLNNTALTGVNVVNEMFRMDVAVTTVATIADNATLYLNVISADTGSGGTPVGTVDFIVEGVLL